MKKIVKRFLQQPIRMKLGLIFLFAFLLMFGINFYMYFNVNAAVRQIDGVYGSNEQLNTLSGALDDVHTSLYQYLSTKSSDTLEEYYIQEQTYRDLIALLNDKTLGSVTMLTEKNIRNMSESYLQEADSAITAKRGRNISKIKEKYAQSEKLYERLQASIDGLNIFSFQQNSDNYIVLRNSLNFLVGIGILLLIMVMGIVAIWLTMMTRNITEPLIRLAGAANEVAAGNMEVDFPFVETGDELTTVAKAFNKMLESIRRYIEETKENMLRESRMKENELIMKSDLNEAQLKYLQAQINPHFLFNTVNAGVQLAMMEGAEKTCMFFENMADFFRYNVRKGDQDATIREELELIDNYIYILNVRFSGDIHYSRQCDKRLLGVSMPAMILQPIVENAVNHGIRGMEGDGEISISVFSDNEKVCISIQDNGPGISEETIARIMSGKKTQNEENTDSTGVGLDNVINRLKRYYNREDVFIIRNREHGNGTEVCLYI